MPKRILTLDDLVAFCATNNIFSFDSKETGYKLCIQTRGTCEMDVQATADSMLYVKVKAFHTNKNRNGSNIPKEVAEKCMNTIKYKPILANFCEVDGVEDFTSHDFEISEDGIHYLEHQIGCFTADEPWMEHDAENDRDYIYAYAAIPREYTPAADIIERKGGTKVSVEIFVNKMSYDAKKKELILEDIEIMGLTCLGVNPETGQQVEEGMEGANLEIVDFSAEANSVLFKEDKTLIETLEKSKFNIQANSADYNSKKGGNSEMLDELLQKYNKTIEELPFEYEGLSEDELNLAFEEAFGAPLVGELFDGESGEQSGGAGSGGAGGEGSGTEGQGTQGSGTEGSGSGSDSGSGSGSGSGTGSGSESSDQDTAHADTTVEIPPRNISYSISFEDQVKTFELSFDERQYALYQLVNSTYGESDGCWYWIQTYDSYVVMEGDRHCYKQSYEYDGEDKVSLVGERVEVFQRYLTSEEVSKLDEMNANYDSMLEKLGSYESEPEKVAILNSNEYESIFEMEEFVELSKIENHFNMSIDEVREKADEILLQYAKMGAINFAKEDESEHAPIGKKNFISFKKNSTSRYGKIFAK